MLPNMVNHRGLVFETYSVTVTVRPMTVLIIWSAAIGVVTDDTGLNLFLKIVRKLCEQTI